VFSLRLLTLLLLLGGPAFAGVSRAALDAVYVDPKPGAALPVNLEFRDDGGLSPIARKGVGWPACGSGFC
jgi:hypothetical protein